MEDKVLKNCKPFLDVIAMAYGQKVRYWSAEHFQRAENWCQFFEKVIFQTGH